MLKLERHFFVTIPLDPKSSCNLKRERCMKRVFIWITALPLLLLGGGVDLPALAASDSVVHAWSDWTIDTSPSCTEAGSKSRHCIYCQAKDAPMSIPALGHAFGAWTLDRSPDCSNSGVQHRSCLRCGMTESESLNALGHSFGAWKVEQANPCTHEGQALRTCWICQTQEVRRIPAAGHVWSPWTELRNASCTEAGEQGRSCSICGQCVEAPLPATGHVYGSWEEQEPSCTEDGDRQRICASCGEWEYAVLSALGHSYAQWTVDVPATCTEEGLQSHHCSLCGETSDETVIVPLGHQYRPSSDAGSEETVVCQRCSQTEFSKRSQQLYPVLTMLNVLLAGGFALWIIPDVKTLLWYKRKKQAFLKKVGK